LSRATYLVDLQLEFEIRCVLIVVSVKVDLEASIAQYKARKVKIKLRTPYFRRYKKRR
jgi:hypothetical protein